MTLTEIINSIDIPSFIGGLVIPVIALLAFAGLRRLFTRKKKVSFEIIRKEIKEGYDGLIRASQTMHKLNDVFNDAEAEAKK